MAISKAKILYWSKNCIKTIEAGKTNRTFSPKEEDVRFQGYCNGKIHTHELLREHLLKGTFDED